MFHENIFNMFNTFSKCMKDTLIFLLLPFNIIFFELSCACVCFDVVAILLVHSLIMVPIV